MYVQYVGTLLKISRNSSSLNYASTEMQDKLCDLRELQQLIRNLKRRIHIPTRGHPISRQFSSVIALDTY